MGFLDKAKSAASGLASKADSALSGAGAVVSGTAESERFLKELGFLAYLEATGRPVDPAQRDHYLAALRDLESKGMIPALATPTGPPPPPGQAAAAQVPQPPAPAPVAPPAQAPQAPAPAPQAPAPAAAPPPPPSWAASDDSA